LYDELLHVPLIIYTGGLQKVVTISNVVGHLGVAPTALSLVGLSPEPAFLGQNLFDANFKDDTDGRVIAESSHAPWSHMAALSLDPQWLQYAVRTKNWKYIQSPKRGVEELYDLQKDPHEKDNVANIETEIVTKFRNVLDDHKKLESKANGENIPLGEQDDRALTKRLKALGYE
jgi:arylsulfatase A-like enzyme